MSLSDIFKIKKHWRDVTKYLEQYGITPQNAYENKGKVYEILGRLGINQGMIDKFFKWGKPVYNHAKGFLPKQFQNIDVDMAEQEIRKVLKLDDSVPSYDYRRTDKFEQESIGYSMRSKHLPD